MTDEAIAALAPRIGTRAACAAAGVAQASWYRRHRASPAPARRPPVPHRDRVQPRALSPAERAAILAALHAERFADTAPAEVWAILLDEDTYLGSLTAFCRLLRQAGKSRERRAQSDPPRRCQARAHRHRAESGLVAGHHQAARPGEMDLLLPLRHPRHLLPLRSGPIALIAAEIRRLFNGLIITQFQARLAILMHVISYIQHWSTWRRLHQGHARRSRYQRRLAAEGDP